MKKERCVKMITENPKTSGSPDPSVQGKDGETAGTGSVLDSEECNAALKLVAQLKQKRIHNEITSIQRAHGLVGRSS